MTTLSMRAWPAQPKRSFAIKNKGAGGTVTAGTQTSIVAFKPCRALSVATLPRLRRSACPVWTTRRSEIRKLETTNVYKEAGR